MQSDFSVMAKRARAQVIIPEVPMAMILLRSRALRSREKVRALVLAGIISLAMVGTAAAFGTNIYNGVQLLLFGNRAAIVIQSFVMVREPTAIDLRRAVEGATFATVLPVGLPAGTRLWRLEYAPAVHPNMIFLEYRNDRTNFHPAVGLFDTSDVNNDAALLPSGVARPTLRDDYEWRVGGETVVVLKRAISQKDAQRVQSSMLATTPVASLAATEPMLSSATIMGAAPDLDRLAARYAPAKGHTVMLGPPYIASIAQLAKRGKPLLDSRVVYLANIPSSHGEPNYAKATLRWPHVVVIPVAGVRAIDAVLRSTGTGDCRCDIFFNQPNAATYWVWKLQRSPSLVLHKYVVDAKTFAVKK
jgi:hypothetical protein